MVCWFATRSPTQRGPRHGPKYIENTISCNPYTRSLSVDEYIIIRVSDQSQSLSGRIHLYAVRINYLRPARPGCPPHPLGAFARVPAREAPGSEGRSAPPRVVWPCTCTVALRSPLVCARAPCARSPLVCARSALECVRSPLVCARSALVCACYPEWPPRTTEGYGRGTEGSEAGV